MMLFDSVCLQSRGSFQGCCVAGYTLRMVQYAFGSLRQRDFEIALDTAMLLAYSMHAG